MVTPRTLLEAIRTFYRYNTREMSDLQRVMDVVASADGRRN